MPAENADLLPFVSLSVGFFPPRHGAIINFSLTAVNCRERTISNLTHENANWRWKDYPIKTNSSLKILNIQWQNIKVDCVGSITIKISVFYWKETLTRYPLLISRLNSKLSHFKGIRALRLHCNWQLLVIIFFLTFVAILFLFSEHLSLFPGPWIENYRCGKTLLACNLFFPTCFLHPSCIVTMFVSHKLRRGNPVFALSDSLLHCTFFQCQKFWRTLSSRHHRLCAQIIGILLHSTHASSSFQSVEETPGIH